MILQSFRMANQTTTMAGHTVHSIQVQKDVVTDLAEASVHSEQKYDQKYPVSEV